MSETQACLAHRVGTDGASGGPAFGLPQVLHTGYIRPFTRIYIYIYLYETYVVVVYNGKKMEITTVSRLSGLPAAAMTCSFTGHAYTLRENYVGVTGRVQGQISQFSCWQHLFVTETPT